MHSTSEESSFLPRLSVSNLYNSKRLIWTINYELVFHSKFSIVEKAYFVLDTQTGVIHVFKTLDQDKPSESFSLSRGTFPDKLSKLAIKLIPLSSNHLPMLITCVL